MRKLKENIAGTALLWTMMLLILLSLLAMAALGAGLSYTARSTVQNEQQQAYYTALSAVELVASQFTGTPAPDSNADLLLKKLDADGPLTIRDLRLPTSMGSCVVTLTLEAPNRLRITADATANGSFYSLSGIMAGDIIRHDGPGYGDGTPGFGAGGITGGGGGMSTDPGTDMYIWKDSPPFELDNMGNSSSALYASALYSMAPVYIKSTRPNGKGYTHLHGEIVAENSVYISDNATAGWLPMELIPEAANGRVDCCPAAQENTDPRIHTTGLVRMTGASVMGGGITATAIELFEKSRVLGSLTAETITLDHSEVKGGVPYNVYGDVTGNTVTIGPSLPAAGAGSHTVIHGNISGNNVVISGSPIITGSVTANRLTIDGSPTIIGDVTAYELELGPGERDWSDAFLDGTVTAVNLTMSDNAIIHGVVNCAQLVMNNNARVDGTVTTETVTLRTTGLSSIMGDLNYFSRTGPVSDKVTGVITQLTEKPVLSETPVSPQVAVKLVPPIVSEMPKKPAPPAFPPKPSDALLLKKSANTVTVGKGDEDSFYYWDSKTPFKANLLRATGTGRIFIYLEPSTQVSIQTMEDSYAYAGSVENDPNKLNTRVFFILGEKSVLQLNNNSNDEKSDFPLYVWSKEKSDAKLRLGNNTKLVGGIWLDNVESRNDDEYHWVPPPDLSDILLPPDSGDDTLPDPDPEDPGEEAFTVENWCIKAYSKEREVKADESSQETP